MTKKEEQQQLEKLRDEAISLMRKKGYTIEEPITVAIDADLPYMGYTTDKDGRPEIVVAGFALKGNMALNLLIHELSHVYRTQTNHPSHNQNLLLSIAAWVMHGKVVEQYQEQILHSLLNSIQDVYADDISFQIFDKHDNLNDFFMSWIKKPVVAKTPKAKWENAEKLVSAAFAQANLVRHQIADTDGKVGKAIDSFLEHYDKQGRETYLYFKDFLTEMPEEITEKAFENKLIVFLGAFLKLTK